MGKKYSQDVHDFIVANYKGVPSRELAEMTNERFGTSFTAKSILSYKKNYHLSSGSPSGVRKNTWSPTNPPGLYEFIRDECQGLSRQQTAAAVNERFGSGTMTTDQAAAYRKNHKLPCGRDTRFKKGEPCRNALEKGQHYPGCEKTWFKKGNRPHNEVEVGSRSVTTEGRHIRKVKKVGGLRERWKFESHIVYEKHFGKIPEGMIVGFKNGDFNNLDPDNLFLMTNEENLEMNRHGKRSAVPEFTETQLTIAKVRIAARKRRKKKGESTT
jgi:hypothetical protein